MALFSRKEDDNTGFVEYEEELHLPDDLAKVGLKATPSKLRISKEESFFSRLLKKIFR